MSKLISHSKTALAEELNGGYSVQSGVFGAVNDKINTTLNEYGLYEANIDLDSLTDSEIEGLASVSSMTNHKLNEDVLGKKIFSKTKGIKHDNLLGYYIDLYAGHVLEGDYRESASSGGLGSWILVQLLERKLIDGVIHVVQSKDEDGILFKYSISKTVKDVRSGAKSRYYPADLSEVLRTVKTEGGKYAITGIPSFITELRLLAEYDTEFKKSIAFTIGLICGHQKSAKYAEALAWQHGIKPGDLISVDFRKKIDGQPANRYISEFIGVVNGKTVTFTKDQDELFVSNWGHGFFKARLSDYTDDAFNELSDVSLGDAWLPEYTKDSKGTNVLIVRNPVIANIIKEGIKTKALALDVLTTERIIRSQSGLAHHNRDELPYRLHRQVVRRLWHPVKRVIPSSDLPFLRKRVQDVREKISSLSHLKYREAVERDDWNYFQKSMRPLVLQYILTYRLGSVYKKSPLEISRKIFVKFLQKN